MPKTQPTACLSCGKGHVNKQNLKEIGKEDSLDTHRLDLVEQNGDAGIVEDKRSGEKEAGRQHWGISHFEFHPRSTVKVNLAH